MHCYTPRGTCCRKICFDITEGRLRGVTFTAGCDGNLKAVSRLVEGMDAREAVHRLKGIDCDGRGTSCADQLARALEEALAAPVIC